MRRSDCRDGVCAISRDFSLLYAVDLVFAAAGCLLAIAVLGVSPPVPVLLTFCTVPMFAGALFGLAERRNAAIGVVALALICALGGTVLSRRESIAKPPHASWLGVRHRERVELGLCRAGAPGAILHLGAQPCATRALDTTCWT